jgi:hypothetical protein
MMDTPRQEKCRENGRMEIKRKNENIEVVGDYYAEVDPEVQTFLKAK